MPKARISRDMIIDAAFEVARRRGVENVNARTVSEALECSTQPVMYHFSTIDDMKRAVYKKTDSFHTDFLMDIKQPRQGIMLGIGLNYVRFAIEEPNLFRFLFQSGFAEENSLIEMIGSSELVPVISAMRDALGMSVEQTKKVFLTIAVFAHGYASIIANNSLEFDENIVSDHLERAYRGAILAVQEEENGELYKEQ